MNILDIPDGSTVQVNVTDCTVTVAGGISGADDQTFHSGGVAFGPFHSGAPRKAETYIVEPQLNQRLRESFRSPFEGAVTITCDIEMESATEIANKPTAPDGLHLNVEITRVPSSSGSDITGVK